MEILPTGNKYSILAKDNMTDRSNIAIKIARINRINKNLSYLLELKEDFYISALDPDFCKIGEWALEIQQYWRECKSPIISNQINNIGSSANFYKLLLSAKLPDDVMGAISLYIDTMKELRAELKKEKDLSKGAYSMLPDELANDEAAILLKRAVDAGFLNNEYQPLQETTNAQLKLIAYAVGKTLNLIFFWNPFERLWKKNSLAGISLPSQNTDRIELIIQLYPEIDLHKLSDYRKYKTFTTNLPEIKLTKIFVKLKEKGYINEDTDINQWLKICGKTLGDEEIKPIIWLKGGRKLIYFIKRLFGQENNCFCKITLNCFINIDKSFNEGSLKSGLHKVLEQEYLNNVPYDKEISEILEITRSYK